MTDLFVTRHGETVWNTEKRFQGWQDSPLTDKGIDMAKKLHKVVVEKDIEVIISSPLKRAKDTAMTARGDLNIPVEFMDEFKELNLGEWEGRCLSDLEIEDADNFKLYKNEPLNYISRGGENFKDLIERVNIGLIKVIQKYEGKRILLVTHGMTLMAIIHLLLRRDFTEVAKEPVRLQTSITHIKIDVLKNKLIVDNDISHLTEEK